MKLKNMLKVGLVASALTLFAGCAARAPYSSVSEEEKSVQQTKVEEPKKLEEKVDELAQLRQESKKLFELIKKDLIDNKIATFFNYDKKTGEKICYRYGALLYTEVCGFSVGIEYFPKQAEESDCIRSSRLQDGRLLFLKDKMLIKAWPSGNPLFPECDDALIEYNQYPTIEIADDNGIIEHVINLGDIGWDDIYKNTFESEGSKLYNAPNPHEYSFFRDQYNMYKIVQGEYLNLLKKIAEARGLIKPETEK